MSAPSDSTEPEILWQPDEETVRNARITAFAERAAQDHGVTVDTYEDLWRWSTTDLRAFWGTVVDHLGVRFHEAPSEVLASEDMPGASWFPGSTLNYAEHALHPAEGGADDDLAIVAVREDGRREQRTYGELRDRRRPRPGRARGARGRARRPGRRPRPELRRDPRRLPRRRVAGGDVVVVLARLRRPRRGRPLRPDRAVRARRRRRLPLQRQVLRHPPDGRRAARAAPDAARDGRDRLRHRGSVGRPRRRRRLGVVHRPRRRRARVRPGAVRPPAVDPLLVGHHGAAEGDRALARRHRRPAPRVAGPAARPRPR